MAKTFVSNLKKTLLTDEELETVQRDLSFRPVCAEAAKTLTARQVETFNRDGFIGPVSAFDGVQVSELRRDFDAILDEAIIAGGDSYSAIDPHLQYGKVYDLMFHPRFLAPLRDLIGPNIACWSTHCLVKLPHDDSVVSWHQDAYYWPLTPSRTVSIWLAIDDADSNNACMQFAAGSHLLGKIPHRLTRQEEKNVLRVAVDGVESYGRIVDDELKAGEISLHADMLLHGSGPNKSDRRRFGVTFRYTDAAVTDLRDWAQHGVMICGQDPRGQWGNPPRPGRG